MKAKPLPSRELLHEYFRYDHETGKLYWKVSKNNKVKVGDEAGSLTNFRYLSTKINYQHYQIHRIIAKMFFDNFVENLQVDHINGDSSDNRLQNLRIVTRQENMKNKALPKNNTSGEIGICLCKRSNKWRVQLTINGKNKYIGLFSDKYESIKARDKAYQDYGFHPNHGKSKV